MHDGKTTTPGFLGHAIRVRQAFQRWRRTRPFYAAGWTMFGGFVLFYLTVAPVHMWLHVGIGGIYGMACGLILMAMGLLMLFAPGQRHVAGVVAVILGVASFPLSNLGGFFVGMFCSVLGGSMAFGWLPAKPERKWRRFRRIQPAPAVPGGEEA